jgi:hypothetical protein
MRFLKTLTLNRRAIYDDRVAVRTDSSVIMNTTNNLLIPKGNTAERPPSPVNGMVRYNTDLNSPYGELEVYQGSCCRVLRFKDPNAVVLQDLGIGNDSDTIFGPLNPDPFTYTAQAGVTWNAAQIAKNLIVIVDTVFQVAVANFEILQNPTSTGTGSEITTGAFVEGQEYVITNVGDTDFTLLGASANTVGTVFTIPTGGGTGNGTTGKVRKTGTYINFYTYVPDTKHAYVYHKFDQ